MGRYLEEPHLVARDPFEPVDTHGYHAVDGGSIAQLTCPIGSPAPCAFADDGAGGGTGYAYVITTFSDMLREAGVTEEQLRTISLDNLRRLLAGDVA